MEYKIVKARYRSKLGFLGIQHYFLKSRTHVWEWIFSVTPKIINKELGFLEGKFVKKTLKQAKEQNVTWEESVNSYDIDMKDFLNFRARGISCKEAIEYVVSQSEDFDKNMFFWQRLAKYLTILIILSLISIISYSIGSPDNINECAGFLEYEFILEE